MTHECEFFNLYKVVTINELHLKNQIEFIYLKNNFNCVLVFKINIILNLH